MPAVGSRMVPLGTEAPAFELKDVVSGRMRTLSELRSDKATVVMFICNHCPYVKHIQKELASLTSEYIKKGVSFIGINPNDYSRYPEDSPENMKKVAEYFGFEFPYLIDESQSIARAYDAACTPDFFVYDGDLKLVYRGRMDDSTPDNGIPVSGRDLRRALDNILAGKPVDTEQKPSLGCSIKWRE